MRARMFVVGGAMLLLAACASTPPVHYYSLVGQEAGLPAPKAPEVGEVNRPGSARAYGLQLLVRGIPAEVDRIQIVVRDPARAPAVDMLNQSLWAAPLDQQIQRVLAAGVAHRLRITDIQQLPDTSGLPVRTLDVRITQFELVWGRGAYLSAVWTDQGVAGKSPRVCHASVQSAAKPGVANLVQAQRHSLAGLVALLAHPNVASVSGLPNDTKVNRMGCT